MNDTQQNQPQPYVDPRAQYAPAFGQQPQPVQSQTFQPQPIYQPVYQPVTVPVYAPAFALKVDRHPQRKQAAKAINRVGAVSFMQTVLSFLLATPLVFLSMAIGVNVYADSMAFQLVNAVSVPLCTALPFFVYLRVGKKDVTEYLKFERVGFGLGLLFVLGGLGISLLANYPAFFIQDLLANFGYEPGDSASIAPAVTSIPLLVTEFLTTAVLVPVMEEFAFRGVLLSSLKRFGPGLSITVSALIFALAHLDISGVVFAFIAGFVFGAIYYYTENLWLSIFIHALNNALAVLSNSLPDLLQLDEITVGILFVTLPMVLGLLAAVILVVRLGAGRVTLRNQRKAAEIPISAGDAFVALLRAPMIWVLFVMMLAYTVSRFF